MKKNFTTVEIVYSWPASYCTEFFIMRYFILMTISNFRFSLIAAL